MVTANAITMVSSCDSPVVLVLGVDEMLIEGVMEVKIASVVDDTELLGGRGAMELEGALLE